MLKKVRNKRPIVKPNSGFMDQLIEFEKFLISSNYELNISGEETKEEVKEIDDWMRLKKHEHKVIKSESNDSDIKSEEFSFKEAKRENSSSYTLPKHFKLHRIEDI